MKRISSDSKFEHMAGYSRMIGDKNWVVSAGTTGFDYSRMTISESLEDQIDKTFENIISYLKDFGATLNDVIICNWVITDRDYYLQAASMIKNKFSPNKPVMMTLVCDLIDERMKFEMQVFAILQE